jgi:hypothetical protein
MTAITVGVHKHASWLIAWIDENLTMHPPSQFYVSEVRGRQGGEIYCGVWMGLNLCVNTTEINSVLIIKFTYCFKNI